ncbi:hypothetical protein [Roseobacter sp. HKCCA0434]|uniref:hypothetical protein n=1 Tax=Roseobacter sp. HKCCA0434 TaxID=3079297 RepID=UPI002905BEA3|nr:hypothetical protein [Roseobacter sp. HKCCA0434]
MDIYIPSSVTDQMHGSALRKRRNRLRVKAGKVLVDILKLDGTGFTLSADAPRLRGSVSLMDGSRHLADCLIVAAEVDGAVTRYEYKRRTAIGEAAPVDYVREDDAPTALLR